MDIIYSKIKLTHVQQYSSRNSIFDHKSFDNLLSRRVISLFN